MRRRVVVTGLGCITPIGNNVEQFWSGIKNGECGIGEITQYDVSEYKVSLAAEVKGFNPEEMFDKKVAKRNELFTLYAMAASREAMKDSGINEENTDFDNIALSMGVGMGGLGEIENESVTISQKGPDRVSPLFIPRAILNMAPGAVSIDLGLRGESSAIVTACASGTHALGQAFRMVRDGYAEVSLAGGTESTICPTGMAGFINMKALSQATDPKRASIPFDKERSGFVMGEGSAMLVLEELEHAKNRGAHIYAELSGYGASSDAYHITSPAPGGEGGARAMVSAMKDAGVTAEDITYINAHGTSTPLNDKYETMAIKTALGDASHKVMVSSTKGHTGHMLGAAGAIEALVCIKAIEDKFVPPTLGYEVPDEECDLDIVPNEGRNVEVNYAMSNSLGFGGHNSTVLFKKYEG